MLDSSNRVGMYAEKVGFDSTDDAAPLTTLAKIPAVSFGPGESRVAHTIDEYVSTENLVNATKAIAIFLIRWCGLD